MAHDRNYSNSTTVKDAFGASYEFDDVTREKIVSILDASGFTTMRRLQRLSAVSWTTGEGLCKPSTMDTSVYDNTRNLGNYFGICDAYHELTGGNMPISTSGGKFFFHKHLPCYTLIYTHSVINVMCVDIHRIA